MSGFGNLNSFLPLCLPEVLLVLVDEPRVILTADKDDRGLGAEPPNLVIPHRPEVGEHEGGLILV